MSFTFSKLAKNLAFVRSLTSDNHAFIEYHPDYFVIKDHAMKKMLLIGNCEGNLYPLKSRSSSNKVMYGAIKSPSSRWHSHLS